MARSLVLASASFGRLGVLRAAGFDPEVIVSGVDEDGVAGTPAEVALALAERKATAVAAVVAQQAGPADRPGSADRPVMGSAPGGSAVAGAPVMGSAPGGTGTGGVVVVGCDSVLDVDGEVRGKPADLDQARAWWASVAGRSAVLHTGHCVVDVAAGRRASALASTTVRYGVPTPAEIDAYLASGEPLGVAGGFTLDGRSAPFIDGIDGDPGTVIGLSLPTLRRLLAGLDIPLVALWH